MARTPRTPSNAAIPANRATTDAATLPTTFPTPAGAVAAARATSVTRAVPTQRTRRPAPPPPPLGSLLTEPAPVAHAAACPACASTSLTRLAMTLRGGAPVTFVSCHSCEARSWFDPTGAPLPLATVLAGTTRA